MNNILENFVSGLQEIQHDVSQDFHFHKVFGASVMPTISFDVADGAPIIIDQSSSEKCTGASSSAMNTVYKTDLVSLVDYLNSQGMDSTVVSRANLALKYGLVSSTQDYIKMASLGTNGPINTQVLALLRYDRGDYFDFEYQYMKICQTRNDPNPNGATIQQSMKGLQTYGSLLKRQTPFTYNTGSSTDQDDTFLANWKNWPTALDMNSAKNKIGSYFAPSGGSDTFSSMVGNMWTSRMNKTRSGFVFGIYFKRAWVGAEKGIIIDDGSPITSGLLGPHAMFARGFSIINSNLYIKAQNSWGRQYGDNGIYYFPASIINKNIPLFGAYAPSALPASVASHYLQNGIQATDNWVMQLLKSIF